MNNKILRIILRQNKAHYRKEESVTNKMTYPLPPYSTIIGAIHNACGYTTYNPMDVSVQGKFESLNQEIYTDQAFLDNTMDDRGILVKLKNSDFINDGYHVVAKAVKSQGNSFRNGTTIDVIDKEELQRYRELLDIRDEFKEKSKEVKAIEKENKDNIKQLKQKFKEFDKNSKEYKEISDNISELKNKNKELKAKFEKDKEINCTIPLSKYFSLTKSVRRYEVLYGVKLVIHIDSDEDTLRDIYDNIYNLTSIGRSEDFVDIIDLRYVEVFDDRNNIKKLEDNKDLSYYVATKALEERVLRYKIAANSVDETYTRRTTYYLNKDYNINDKKRIFNKKRVSYISSYRIDNLKLEDSNVNYKRNEREDMYRIYLDEEGYLVNLM